MVMVKATDALVAPSVSVAVTVTWRGSEGLAPKVPSPSVLSQRFVW